MQAITITDAATSRQSQLARVWALSFSVVVSESKAANLEMVRL
jgi:hypothetical protein